MNLYRYDSTLTDGGQYVYCNEYRIDRETPKGYWIENETKWVSSNGKRRWAYPTIEEAWESFVARKTRQVMILQRQLSYAEDLLSMTKREQATTRPLMVPRIAFGIDFDFSKLGEKNDSKS